MRRTLVIVFALFGAMLLAVPAHAGGSGGNGGPARVTVPDGWLTAAWWRQFMGTPGTLDNCNLGVPGVVFLAGTTGGPVTRTCTIPRAKAVLVPLINAECSTFEDGLRTFRALQKCASDLAVDFTNLSLTVDGRSERNLTRFRVQSGPFWFTSVDGNAFDRGSSGGPTRSVADGYWALIGPLGHGTHTVSFGGSYPPGPFETNATYTLRVN